MVSLPPVERPIDRALSLVAAGDATSALRFAVFVLENEPESALALFVVGYALTATGQKEPAARAFTSAAAAAVDASNLPLAVAASAELGKLGKNAAPVYDAIASAFAEGSSRLVDRRAGPPELPGADPDPETLSAVLDAESLNRRALAALGESEKRVREAAARGSRSVTRQALFSSLGPEALRELVAIFDVQILPSGATLLKEGTVGSEAFIVARGEVEVEKHAAQAGEPAVKLARLGAGALVGEMALLSRAPRAATVTTVRPTIVLLAQKEALDHAAARAPQVARQFAAHCKRRMIDNLVRTSALFRAATPAERPALVERFNLRTFEAGEALATQGERSGGMHLIASGEVSIVHRDGSDKTLLTKLGPGDVVGEVALIFRRPAIADAITTRPTITLFLEESRVLDLVRDLPKVFADLYELAVRRDLETASIAREEATETEDFVIV
jgi:cAMP-dependent protein kinase regulator